ncbi:MAG: hypothetical protein JNL81_15135 [Hyphomonadaceae bacterium]|nr:hypothetical protein [Hyphomonadaceae bacterium]
MLLRKLVVVGLVGFVSFAASIATAEDAVGPGSSSYAVDGVVLDDPSQALTSRFQLSSNEDAGGRFANLAPTETTSSSRGNHRGYEFEFVAPGMSGLNVSFAQRGGFGFNDQGDIDRRSRASELRLGRGLDMPRNRPSAEPTWYFFAASEDEALTWRPGSRSEFGASGGNSFALQDRVEVGDMQAGVTYERYGIQASLAYVEREFTIISGSQSFTQDDSFAGLTITMRH